MHDFWLTITQFGDSGVLLPLGAAFAVGLWMAVSGKVALRFSAAFVGCAAALAGFKLVFLAWGHRWYAHLESPSGHAGLSVLVYGAMGVVALHEMRGRGWQWMVLPLILATASLTTAIAASRKLLGAHSVSEVLAGGAVGALCLALFHRRYPPEPGREGRLLPLYAAMGTLVAVLLGSSFSPEQQIGRAAEQLRRHWPVR